MLGKPTTTSATADAEVLWYLMSNGAGRGSGTAYYFVRIVDGQVHSFGNQHSFNEGRR